MLTRLVAERQRERLEEDGLTRLLEEIELPLVDVLVEMERAGVKLDVKRLREIAGRFGERARDLERRVWDLAGEEFTIGSPQQLAPILFDKLGLSKKRRGKTGFSTDARVLQAIRDEHEIVPAIEEWREVTKLKSTYLDAFPELIADDGRLHTTFNQTAATTGRLSSTNPNLQNIPIRTEQGREIRACFVAEAGHSLISADYSQVELRLLAHIADEPVLKEIFRRGEDVHTATAEAILGGKTDPGTRSKAKMVNYGIVYGLSAFGLADRLQIEREEAQEFIDRYLERFPAVAAFIANTVEQATEDGHVTTLFGRIRRVPELRARNRQTRLLGERLAVNMIIQGTAADIIKVAMVRARDRLREAGLDTRLVLQIHDELLFEAPDAEADAAVEIVRPRWPARSTWTRRSRWTWAWAGTGSRPSSGPRGRGTPHRHGGRAGGHAGADQRQPGPHRGEPPRGLDLLRDRPRGAREHHPARRRRLRQGRRDQRPLLVLPHRRAARRRLRDDGADLGQDARGRRRHGRDDRGPAHAVRDPRPARGARAREARPVRRAHHRSGAARGGHVPHRAGLSRDDGQVARDADRGALACGKRLDDGGCGGDEVAGGVDTRGGRPAERVHGQQVRFGALERQVGEGGVARGGRRGDEQDVARDLRAVGQDDRAQHAVLGAQAGDAVEDLDVGRDPAQQRDEVPGVLLTG